MKSGADRVAASPGLALGVSNARRSLNKQQIQRSVQAGSEGFMALAGWQSPVSRNRSISSLVVTDW